MATTDLVIFDFDGVLADSEIIALAELGKCLAAFGVDLDTDELVARFLGVSVKDILKLLSERIGAGHDDAIREMWYSSLFSRYERELKLMPGALDLLDSLDAAGLRYCIASGGSTRRLNFALHLLGLDTRFIGNAFSADRVDAGKPAPDLFLYAAKTMAASPAASLVVEDATAGVEAAQRAGIRCIGFVGGSHLASRRDMHARLLLERGAEAIVLALSEVLKHL